MKKTAKKEISDQSENTSLLKKIDNNIIKITLIFLFVVPFFWFKYPKLDLGGDGARLYILDPYANILNTSLIPINLLGGANAYFQRYITFPFYYFLHVVKLVLLNSPYLLNTVVNSLILSLGFLFTYLFFKELQIDVSPGKKRLISVFVGLMFLLSPLSIYDFQRANYHVYNLALYPAFFYLILKSISTNKFRYIALNVILTSVFALNFSYFLIPWLLSFLPLGLLFILYYSYSIKRLTVCLKTLFILGIIVILGHFYYLGPFVKQIIVPTDLMTQSIFDQDLQAGGLQYFMSIQPHVKLIYNLYNQPPFGIMRNFANVNKGLMRVFGYYILPVFVVYPIILAFGFLFKDKKSSAVREKLFLFSTLLFLIITFLAVANVGLLPLKIYEKLFIYVPGFRMFRHFYGKFSMSFSFFYSLSLFFALINISHFAEELGKREIFKKFLYVLIALVLFNAIPLLSGQILTSEVPGSTNKLTPVRIPIEVSKEYMDSIEYVKSIQRDVKIMSFPLTAESYQVFQGSDGGAYLGPSSIALLGGKSDFNGLAALYNIDLLKVFISIYNQSAWDKMQRLLGFLNVGILYHNSSNYIYDNFDPGPYGEFKKVMPNQDSITYFISLLNGKRIFNSGTYDIYEENDYFLPHFYVPIKVEVSDEEMYDYFINKDFKDEPVRYAVYLRNSLPPIESFQDGENKVANFDKIPNIEFSRINFAKYRVKIKNATQPFILVQSDQIHPDWRIYLKDEQRIENAFLYNTGRFLAALTAKFSTNSGDDKVNYSYFNDSIKEYSHRNVFLEPNTFETWGKNPILGKNNYIVNAYANSWYITPEDVGGRSDYELIIEFSDHKYFYLSSVVSVVTLVALVIYLIMDYALEFYRSRYARK